VGLYGGGAVDVDGGVAHVVQARGGVLWPVDVGSVHSLPVLFGDFIGVIASPITVSQTLHVAALTLHLGRLLDNGIVLAGGAGPFRAT